MSQLDGLVSLPPAEREKRLIAALASYEAAVRTFTMAAPVGGCAVDAWRDRFLGIIEEVGTVLPEAMQPADAKAFLDHARRLQAETR